MHILQETFMECGIYFQKPQQKEAVKLKYKMFENNIIIPISKPSE